MTGKLAKLRALSWPERRVLLQAALLLPLYWAGLRALGLSRMQRTAEHASASTTPRRDLEPARIGTLIAIASNHLPFPSTCLSRSLLLLWMLGRRGLKGELRIGVCKAGDGIESHAWVEHEGRPVNDSSGEFERYAAFPALPLRRPQAPR